MYSEGYTSDRQLFGRLNTFNPGQLYHESVALVGNFSSYAGVFLLMVGVMAELVIVSHGLLEGESVVAADVDN